MHPDSFGADLARPIAWVNERGIWRLAQADLARSIRPSRCRSLPESRTSTG
jgi:hypothetical protein